MTGLLFLACAGGAGLSPAELPDAPLAILYRTPVEVEERVDRLRELRGEREQERGIARLGDLERVLGREDVELPGLGGRLVLLDPRRGEVTELTGVPRAAFPLDWSTDRRLLLISAPVRDGRQLFSFDTQTGALIVLTYGPASHPMGCYLADDRVAVAEVTGRAGRRRAVIGVIPSGGGAPRRITEGPLDLFPVCSPDGRHVAFVHHGGEAGPQIAAVALEGGEMRNLVRGADPAFVPDGEWLVYSAPTSRGQRLWRVRLDGRGRAPVGRRWESGADETTPAVSPDGRFVAYVLREEDRDHLRVRRLDGQGDRPLLAHGDGFAPIW